MKNNTFYQEYYSELYNPEQKIQFIEEEYHGNENTKKSIIYNFKKATREEKRLDKDLCLFSIQDIDNIGFDYKTENMIQQALSYFSSYTEWCIKNGLRGLNETGVNDFAIYMSTQDLSKLIPRIKTVNRYLTREEVIDLTNNLGNPVDQAFVLCLYEGIAGEKLYELRSLKKMYKLNTNKIVLTDLDGATREITISDKLRQTLMNASHQDEYIRGNGKGVGRSSPVRLADTPYIIRTLNRETTDGEIVNYGTLSQKMVRIKEYTGYKFISIGSVRDSGMINRIVELTKQHGLQKPNDVIFNILRQPDEYNISANTLYRLKQKYELATDLKDFN